MALKVANHFYLMEQGRVTFSGEPGKLAEDEVIQRAYLGTRRAAHERGRLQACKLSSRACPGIHLALARAGGSLDPGTSPHDNMVDLIQNTLDGVMVGSSYALLALGFTLIFGTMRRLNLAYGPTIMAGAYLGTYAFARLGIGALPVALLVDRRRGAGRPLRGAALLPPVRRSVPPSPR